MPRKEYKRKSPEERIHILQLLSRGVTDRVVARSFNINIKTVRRIEKKYRETGHVKDLPRKPKPCKISKRDFRNCVREFKRKQHQSVNIFRSMIMTQYGVRYSKSGLRKFMKREKLIARIKRKKPLVSKLNRFRSVMFARRHLNWTISDWKRVVWSDEVSFVRIRRTGTEYLYVGAYDNIRVPN